MEKIGTPLRAQLQLTTDAGARRPEALERFYIYVNRLGNLQNSSTLKNGRLTWPWVAVNADAEQVIVRLLPHLADEKRSDAIAALDTFRTWEANRHPVRSIRKPRQQRFPEDLSAEATDSSSL
jgi:hypothetical protein